MHNEALLSLGVFCDNGYKVYLTKTQIFTTHMEDPALHKAAFSPVKSTWIQAINAGFFTTWPNLTADLVEKHLETSPATVKGHLRQIWQNLRSTSKSTIPSTTTNTPRVMTISPSRLSHK